MLNKNINTTTENETIIPLYYIDKYQGENKEIMQGYKFKHRVFDEYLLKILIDLCISIILENPEINILFTYPPSTMFYRKEKDIDSMGNLLRLTSVYINDYFKINKGHNVLFKSLFIPNIKHLKNKTAQHIDGNRNKRIKDLNQRYIIKFWNNRFIINNMKIIIIDDISSTGGTLLACKNILDKYIQNKNLNNIEVLLYSLYH